MPVSRPSSRTSALLATIICHSIWGFSFMFSSQALGHVPVFLLLSRKISGQYTAFERTYVMMGLAALVFTLLILLGIWGVQRER